MKDSIAVLIDICNRPKRNERLPEGGDNRGLYEEGLGSVPSPLKPNGSPDSGSSLDSKLDKLKEKFT